jgi:hypothetical protein
VAAEELTIHVLYCRCHNLKLTVWPVRVTQFSTKKMEVYQSPFSLQSLALPMSHHSNAAASEHVQELTHAHAEAVFRLARTRELLKSCLTWMNIDEETMLCHMAEHGCIRGPAECWFQCKSPQRETAKPTPRTQCNATSCSRFDFAQGEGTCFD